MGNIHFTLGKDLGIRLHEISLEHINDFNIDKAINVWTNSFGCSNSIAERLALMDLICDVTDTESCQVDVMKRDVVDENRIKDYPEFDFKNFIEKIKRIFSTERDTDEELWFVDFRYMMSEARRYICANNPITYDLSDIDISKVLCGLKLQDFTAHADIKPAYLAKYMLDNNELPKDFDTEGVRGYDKTRFTKIVFIISRCQLIMELENDINHTLDVVSKYYPIDEDFKYSLENAFKDVRNYMNELKHYLEDYGVSPKITPVFSDVAVNVVDNLNK